ncbi:hypothetical protein [Modestobacter sp. SYSU DS0290]
MEPHRQRGGRTPENRLEQQRAARQDPDGDRLTAEQEHFGVLRPAPGVSARGTQ